MKFIFTILGMIAVLPVGVAFAASPYSDATEIYDAVMPSLCAIISLDTHGEELGFGSGFVLSSDGRVVTNAHVVSGAASVRVECNAKKGNATMVVGYQSGIDLVVLQTDLKELRPLVISVTQKIKPGMVVFVLGNPYGFEGTITTGLISGVRKFDDAKYIQMSAEINPGNSGGPVVNLFGEVVGISTMQIANTQGLNFALPASLIGRCQGRCRIFMLRCVQLQSVPELLSGGSDSQLPNDPNYGYFLTTVSDMQL